MLLDKHYNDFQHVIPLNNLFKSLCSPQGLNQTTEGNTTMSVVAWNCNSNVK